MSRTSRMTLVTIFILRRKRDQKRSQVKIEVVNVISVKVLVTSNQNVPLLSRSIKRDLLCPDLILNEKLRPTMNRKNL